MAGTSAECIFFFEPKRTSTWRTRTFALTLIVHSRKDSREENNNPDSVDCLN